MYKVAFRLVLLGLFFFSDVLGHGRLIEPPSRASMWRYGFKTPHNYNDHELYCGGYTRQWQRNNGKCGICGDPWDIKLVSYYLLKHEIKSTMDHRYMKTF